MFWKQMSNVSVGNVQMFRILPYCTLPSGRHPCRSGLSPCGRCDWKTIAWMTHSSEGDFHFPLPLLPQEPPKFQKGQQTAVAVENWQNSRNEYRYKNLIVNDRYKQRKLVPQTSNFIAKTVESDINKRKSNSSLLYVRFCTFSFLKSRLEVFGNLFNFCLFK